MSVDLDSLRCFELAATTLNFRAASARAYLSPGAFSDRLHRLEESLGVPLFERTTRSVRLTAAGARLLPHARACLQSAETMTRTAKQESESWELTVGTRYELGLSWLVPALDALAAARPERTIHLAVGDGPALLESVRLGRIDAMVASLRIDGSEFVSEILHDEAYVFVAAPRLLEGAPFSGIVSAPAHTLLDANPSLPLFRYLLDRVGGTVWPFARREYLGGIGAVRARALAGKGVAVLPRYFVAAELAFGALIELMPHLPPASDTFRLVWRSGHARGADLVEFGEELRQFPLK